MVGGGGNANGIWVGDVCERACFFATSDTDNVLVENWNFRRIDIENQTCTVMDGPAINQNFVVFQPQVLAKPDGLSMIGVVQATMEKCRATLLSYY